MCTSSAGRDTKLRHNSPGAHKRKRMHRDLTAYLSSSWALMSYRCAATGVEEKVGSVGSSRGLVGDRSVAQSHANNGSHVSFCAKYMDGDPSGLSWKTAEDQTKPSIFKPESACS